MKKALVIGAGPAGLTAAYELLTKSKDIEVTILEESDCFGGISKTVNYKGNRMDMGGHRFFSKIPEVNDWWDHMLPMQGHPTYDDILLNRPMPLKKGGPDPEKEDRVMLMRHRVSRILFDSKFYDYPVSLKLETLKNWVQDSHAIVFFGGAGVSTESGIPDFRSQDGLYRQKFDYPPETIISHSFYQRNPSYFFRFYREKMLPLGFEPNITHKKLAQWEREGKLAAVVTQNIDGLHQKAGSKNVYELHGSVLRNYCTRCRRFYSAEFIRDSEDIPRCSCGGIIKPDVVLYEEGLDQDVLEKSIMAIRDADLLMVAGTSLTVYPAAGLLRYYRGNRLVLINRDETPYDSEADLVIHDRLGNVFSQL